MKTNDEEPRKPFDFRVTSTPVRFDAVIPGLFLWEGELCVKTQYRDRCNHIDAYVVANGSYFWGNSRGDHEVRDGLMVTPVIND